MPLKEGGTSKEPRRKAEESNESVPRLRRKGRVEGGLQNRGLLNWHAGSGGRLLEREEKHCPSDRKDALGASPHSL